MKIGSNFNINVENIAIISPGGITDKTKQKVSENFSSFTFIDFSILSWNHLRQDKFYLKFLKTKLLTCKF